MSFYTINRYGNKTTLPTKDPLHAVKVAVNYHSDLYDGGKLIFSLLSLPMGVNLEHIASYGLTGEVLHGRWVFRYLDDAKNKTEYFMSVYKHNKTGKVTVTIRDYKETKQEKKFDTMEDLISHVDHNFLELIGKEMIQIQDYVDGNYKSYFL